MARKPRVQYELDTGGIEHLPLQDIIIILRGADELINTGGRSMLAKILKGSRDKKLLELNLQECPAYGYYHDKTLQEITKCIDYCIVGDYLDIQYNGRLPTLVFSPKGWEIERHTYAMEWYQRLKSMAENKTIDMEQIKELLIVNREVVLEVLDTVKMENNVELEPVLLVWKEIEVKKVRSKIGGVIASFHKDTEAGRERQGKR